MRIILASASPRREELLGKLFQTFEVIPAKGEECVKSGQTPQVVLALSEQKAKEVERESAAQEDAAYLIIGADTLVAVNGQILGKPQDSQDAAAMLRRLQGNVHQVYTGVTLLLGCGQERRCIQFTECTDVYFYPITEEEILAYIHTKEPMDKAGSYGIQGIGGRFVKRIDGDYSNVVGLPVAGIYQRLKKIPEVLQRMKQTD